MKKLSERNWGAAIGLGTAFGVVGWVLFENVGVAIGFGIALGIAFSGAPKKSLKNQDSLADDM